MRNFNLLGVRLELETQDAEALQFVDAFLAAYDGHDGGSSANVKLRARLRRAHVPERFVGEPVEVHRSPSQPEWNFDGRRRTEGGRVVVAWPTRSALVEWDSASSTMDVTVSPSESSSAAGEAFFHACRSVALSLRPPHLGALLHAGAVAGPDGAVAFSGDPLAGKTTLMIASVLNHDLQPLSNDRLLVTFGVTPQAVSFPGYFSCCEGTLLAHEPLARAANAFESPANPLRTMPREEALRCEFTKRRKRMYPMAWFAEAVGRRYAYAAPLRALVLPRVVAGTRGHRLQRLDLANRLHTEALHGILTRNVFGPDDPSFRPWHGLRPPDGQAAARRLLETLRLAGVPVYRLRTDPHRLDGLAELLAETTMAASAR